MPQDPFGDLESLFSEGDLGVTRGAGESKGNYTPTRKEAVVRETAPAASPNEKEKPRIPSRGTPTRLEPLPLFRTGERTPIRREEASEDAAPFKPTRRPPMALLCYLDDGSEDGEWFRMRTDRFVIGRTEGDVRIPHDGMISPRHAEIT